LHNYEFKYDSVPGRKQIGVLGPIAQKYFPEAVEVVAQYVLPGKTRSETITLSNFPVVDKNVILLHGVAALQQLIASYRDLDNQMKTFSGVHDELMGITTHLNTMLSKEANEVLLESARSQRNEAILLQQQLHNIHIAGKEEKALSDLRIEGSKHVFEREERILQKRIMHEENLVRESLLYKLELEKKLSEERELLRRQTHEKIQKKREEYGQALEVKKIELEKEKITVELEAKAKQEIENEDMTIRKMQLQAKLDTDRFLEIIRTTSKHIGAILGEFISRPQQLMMVFGAVVALVVIYQAFRELISIAKTFFQLRLGRPSLVRETSFEWTIQSILLAPWKAFWRESDSYTFKYIQKNFEDVILSKENKERVIQLAIATRNTKKSSAPYRHVLLFGSAGTGKPS
jgi:ATPase family AAA domain-containing protein 3A/B